MASACSWSCSDANAARRRRCLRHRSTESLGFIPTGWYPTAVRVLEDNRMVVLNGRGLRSYPESAGWPEPPKAPEAEGVPNRSQDMWRTSRPARPRSSIRPDDDTTRPVFDQVLANSPYRDAMLEDAGAGPSSPHTRPSGDPSPIAHVVYIVKENRTYDQVLGDIEARKQRSFAGPVP